ncbi:MAG: hypothetical protein ACRYGP_30175 [Janthinobacterium lividum]
MLERRSFLRNLITLPLIGGGVTLIGAPSAPVPLVQAAAMPTLDDPRQRARYAWEAFSAAMRDVTAGADGWSVTGFDRVTPVPHYGLTANTHCRARAIRYRYTDVGSPRGPGVYEDFDEVEL